MQTAELVFDRTGQVVEFYPPEAVRECLGQPSSVNAAVYFGTSSNDETPDFVPTVTVDTVSTTSTAAAGVSSDPRNAATVALVTGIVVGRPYLIDNQAAQRELVECKRVAVAGLQFVSDLQYDYPITTSTLKGVRCVFTIDPTWVADEDNILAAADPSYRVVWSYTVAGTVYSHQTYLRLVRKPFKSTVTYEDLIARWPEVLGGEARDQRGEKYRRMIDAAEETVRTDLAGEGYKPEQVSDTEVLDRLVLFALDYQIGRFQSAPKGRDRESFVAECKQEYSALLTKHVSVLKVAVDQGTAGSTTVDPIQNYFFRR